MAKKKKDLSKMSDKQFAAGFAGAEQKGVGALAIQIKEQNKIAQDNKTDMERNQKLNDLIKTTAFGDKEGRDASSKLRQEYRDNSERLQSAIESGDKEQIALEKASQQKILDGADNEEKRREAVKAVEKQSGLLGKIAGGIGSIVKSAKDNAGAIGGLGLLALAILDPEKMQALIKKVIEILGKAVDIVQKIITGDISGAFEVFASEWKSFTGAFILLFGGKLITAFKVISKVFPKIRAAVNLFRASFIGQYISGMISHFKNMMKSLGGKLMKMVKALTAAANVFRLFMMGTFLPGMLVALISMGTALAAVLAPFAVPIAIALGIALIVAAIGFALTKLRDALGFTSVFDVLMLGVAHLQDAFGHIVNLMGAYVNFILGMVEKFGKFLGFEIDLPEIPKMSTDNAAKKKVEFQQKKIDEDNAEFAKTDLGKSVNTTGDELDMSSMDNKMEGQFLNQAAAPVIVNNVNNSSTTSNKSSSSMSSSTRSRDFGLNNYTVGSF